MLFKNIPNTVYSIDITGAIVKTGRISQLKPHTGKDGYVRIALYANNKRVCKYVHRLVAEVFLDNPDKLPEVNHIDGNRSNNNSVNLEWITTSKNVKYAYDSGRKIAPHLGKLGADNHNSKPVIGIHKDTGSVITFPGASDAARNIGKNKSSIINVIAGRRKTSGGYKWSYL